MTDLKSLARNFDIDWNSSSPMESIFTYTEFDAKTIEQSVAFSNEFFGEMDCGA